jgi:pilus assembly protein FimV
MLLPSLCLCLCLGAAGCGDKGGGAAGAAGTSGGAGSTGGAGTTGTAGTTGAAGAGNYDGSAGSGGTGGTGGTGGVLLGCKTNVAPALPLIADFTRVDGGAMIPSGIPGGIFTDVNDGTPSPSPTVSSAGVWTIAQYVAVAAASETFATFGMYFSPPDEACLDGHSYQGISFKLGGTISGCSLRLLVGDSAHTKMKDARGACTAATCEPVAKELTIPASPTVVQIPWSGLSGGKPDLALDPKRLTSIAWQFAIPPAPDGGNGACFVDLTIDDVSFY